MEMEMEKTYVRSSSLVRFW